MKKQPFQLLKSPTNPTIEAHIDLGDGYFLAADVRPGSLRRLEEIGFELKPTGEVVGSHEVLSIKKP
jgi:hypothetical protein